MSYYMHFLSFKNHSYLHSFLVPPGFLKGENSETITFNIE